MNIITSAQNIIIKEIKSLKNKKSREETGSFLIEGLRFVEEALKEEAYITKVVMSESFFNGKFSEIFMEKAEGIGAGIYIAADKLFKDMSDTETPQGILAVVKLKRYCIEDIYDGDLIIILDCLQDPGNMGTIIRTADAVSASAVIVSKGSVDVYNSKVLRSTMGSVFHVPIVFSDNLAEDILKLKSKGIKIISSHLKGENNYFEAELNGRIALVVGNEGSGISDEVAASSDMLVKIPMPGRAESLNASVAASLLMYEALRQRSIIK